MSNSSLAESLRQFAIESGEIANPIAEDPSLIGAEEITIVTDNTQTELEEALEETSEKVEKMEDNGAGAEAIQEAVESLESYVGSLLADREAGLPLTGQGMKYFNMGLVASLEARGIPAEIYSAEVLALQTSFESASTDDYSTEAEAATQGMLARLWSMLRAAVTAVATAFKEFFTMMGKSATAIEAAGNKLKRVGAGLKGDAKEGKIKVGKGSRLGEGTAVDPVKALDALKSHYSSDVLGITKEIRGALGDLASVLKNPTAASLKSWEAGVADKAPASKTVVLPGAFSLKYVAGVGGGAASLSKANFSVVGSANANAAGEMTPLTPSEITALGGKLVDISKMMNAAMKDCDAVVRTNEDLLKAADAGVKKANGGDADSVAAARGALSAAKSAINANKGLIPAYIRHVGAAAKEAYGLGIASARKYGSKEAAAAPAAEPAAGN